MCVYLIHLSQPYKHASHYLGYAKSLDARIAEHRNGSGARFLQVVNAAGIEWQVVRVWEDAGREWEHVLKLHQHNKRLCPVCTPHTRHAVELYMRYEKQTRGTR